jgi:N-acetylglucosaminyldiphosphoundecaprenol N-acetyl-beta-D-mannosaminyltransferase
MEKSGKKVNILGINISSLKKSEVLEKIRFFLSGEGQYQIVTPNPEIILTALKDEELFYILNNADLVIPDGIGLKFAAWLTGKNIERIAGADLVKDILKIAQRENKKVAILNWDKGLSSADDIKKAITKNYSDLKFVVEDVKRGEWQNPPSPLYAKGENRNFNPDILFCALGAPWQEKLIFHNLKKWPSVKIAMGVGGSFDFLTGKTRRAPRVMRLLGLEWLWRLFKQKAQPPLSRFSRIKRIIYSAIILFPLKFFIWRFILPFLYRPNVACILFKREEGKYKILLVKRSDQSEHWQLPQGGIDGENIKTAGERELSEEIGTTKFKTITVYKNIFKYQFNERAGKYNYPNKKTIGYKGQKQSLIIAEFLGTDEDIKINFWDHEEWKWVEAENLINKVHPVRKEAAEIFIKKFDEIIK